MHNQNRILRVLQLIAILQKAPAKSIKHLASLIETTERTMYRYLDLIKQLGFTVEKDEYLKFYIPSNETNAPYNFTDNEISLLQTLLKTSAKNNKLKDSILKKMNVLHEITIGSKDLLHANLGVIIENITTGITENKIIELKNYQSASSNTIKTRVVEPITLTDNYNTLIAYEINTQKIKLFNVDRIGEVKITKQPLSHKKQYDLNSIDVFGFAKSKDTYVIELNLNLRAYVILKQEFPLINSFIKKTNTHTYYLTVTVNNLKPITRFVLGLTEDVEVIGSAEFKQHLKNTTKDFILRLTKKQLI